MPGIEVSKCYRNRAWNKTERKQKLKTQQQNKTKQLNNPQALLQLEARRTQVCGGIVNVS